MRHKDESFLEEEKIEETEKRKGPWSIIISVFLALLIVLMSLPYYSIKLNPEPKNIPTLKEVLLNNTFSFTSPEYENPQDILKFVDAKDPIVKGAADRIVTASCEGSNKICYAKALFYFVRDEFDYVNDPTAYEYVKTARESLLNHAGDCDDASVLLANLEESIGIPARFVFIPRHVYIQIYLPEAPKRYQQKDGWINLDATCSYCKFSEIPYKNVDADKRIIS